MHTNKKHLLGRLVAFLAVAFITVGTVQAQVSVSVAPIQDRPNQTVTVPVTIGNVAGNVNSFQFTVNTDANLTYTGYSTAGTLSATGWNVAPPPTTGGSPTTIGGFSGTPITANGTLINLNFTLGAAAAVGNVNLTLVEVNGAPPAGGATVTAPYTIATVFLNADATTVLAGAPAPITISSADVVTNLAAFTVDVTVAAGQFATPTVAAGALTAGWTTTINPLGGGVYRIGGFGTPATGAGSLFVLNGTAGVAGVSPVVLTNPDLTNNLGANIPVGVTDGSLTVTANQTPVATAQAVSTNQGVPVTITLAGTDAESNPLTFAIATNPANGTLSAVVGSSVTYTPNGGFGGADAFTFTANDGFTTSAAATVSITVNRAPTATNPPITTTNEDVAVNITMPATDPDGDALTYAVGTAPSNGTIVITGNVAAFTPRANFFGTDLFTFTATDPGGLTSNIGSVSITIASVNDAPVVAPQGINTLEDTAGTVTMTAVDVEAMPVTFALGTAPTNGTATVTAAGLATYTPNANYNGGDTFTVIGNDGTDNSAPATVTVVVTAVNDAPVATAGADVTLEDTAKDITLAGTDIEGSALTFAIATQPANGTVTLVGATATYTPNANYNGGPDTFTFTANDGTVDSAPASVVMTVTAVNDAPVVADDAVTTDEDTDGVITLASTDVEGDAVTYTVGTAPANGSVAIVGALATYTPNPDYNGGDTFTVIGNDGTDNSAPATMTVTVTPVNDAPVATPGADTTLEDTAKDITLAGTDVDLDALTFAIATQPANGAVTLVGATATYTPNANYNGGPDTFTFTANDGTVDSAPASVVMTVTAVNDAPVVADDAVTTDEDTDGVITLASTDVEGDAVTYALGTAPTNGTAVVTPAGVATYTPNPNYNGGDTFTVIGNDGTVDSAPATMTVTVTAVNDAPTANADAVTTAEDVSVDITLTGGDVDGDVLTFTATQPANGTVVVVGTTATYTYTPGANFNGTDTFTFTSSDGTLTSAAATVTVTVTPVNDAPVVADGALTTNEDTAGTVTLTSTDVDGDAVTYALAGAPTNGTAVVTPAGVLTYTPNANYNGADTITVTGTDGTLTSAVATIAVTVTSVNDAPTTTDPPLTTTLEDNSVAITLLAADVDGDPLTFTVATAPLNGTVTFAGNVATYVPAANYFGTDLFKFTAHDGKGGTSNVGTVDIVITSVNDAPVVAAGALTTDEDTAGTIALTSTDVEGEAVTYAVGTAPTNGAVTIAGAVATYTPNADYNGADAFTIIGNDGTDDSAAAAMTVTVTSVNDAPTADDAAVTTAEDVSIDITLTGADVDGDVLTFTATQPANGTVVVVGTTATYTYTPGADFNGTDTFTFTSSDGTLASAAATVTVTITPVNDAPVVADGTLTTAEDTAGTVTLTSTDAEGDAVTYAIVTGPTSGTATLAGDVITYTPNADYNGDDTITVTGTDGTLTSAVATIAVTVTAVNDAPTANADAVTTAEDVSIDITLTGADVDGDVLTFAIATAPVNGTVVVVGTTATYTYTPGANFNGTDSFTFTSSDGTLTSAAATVSLTITAVNDVPVVDNGALTTDEDTAGTVTLTSTDVDGDAVTYAIATGPANGTATLAGAVITYTPNLNYNGADTITVTGTDGTLTSAVATIAVTVTPVNDAPTVTNPADATTTEQVAVDIALSGVDVDGDVLTFQTTVLPANGTVTYVGNIATYTPDNNFNGTDSFKFRASDGTATSNEATASITIRAVNDPPVVANVSLSTAEDTAGNVTLSSTDVEGDPVSYTVATAPTNGTVTITGSTATYMPNADFNGTDSFTVTGNDGFANSAAPGTVSVTVTAVNDAPRITAPAAATTAEEAPVAIALTAVDIEGDAITFAVAAAPANGTVTIAGATATYTPNVDYVGGDSFTFTASDGPATSSPTTATITVTAVNDAPVADAQAVTTAEDAGVGLTLTGSDVEGDAITFAISTQPANGSVVIAGAAVIYSPNADFNGTDTFAFTASDASATSAPATVTVTVTPVNDAPVFTVELGDVSSLSDELFWFNYQATDVDGDALTFAVVSPATATIDADGDFFWFPDGFVGDQTVQVTVSDGTETVSSSVATIMVLPVDGFRLDFAGIHENPPVATLASGSGWVRLVESSGTLEVYADIFNLSSPFTASHIHLAPAGSNGGVAIPLTADFISPNGRDVSIGNTIDLNALTLPGGMTTAEFIAALRDGQAYVNVHSAANGSGEVRSQILESDNEAPSATDVRAPSEVTITGNPDDRLFSVSWLPVTDPNGDDVVYLYQVSTDAAFLNILGTENYGDGNGFRVTVAEGAEAFDEVTGGAPGSVSLGGAITLYHRMITSDGGLWTNGPGTALTLIRGTVTANEDEMDLPTEFALKGNYPNPFNPSTTIQFDLPETADVSIAIVDMLGREVMSVPTATIEAGANRSVQINASGLTSGLYLYRVIARSAQTTFAKVGTMTLIK